MKIRMPTAEETAAHERQREWRTRSIVRLKAEREARRLALEAEGAEQAVRRAVDGYRTLDDPGTSVRLRSSFIALSTPRELPPALGGPDRDDLEDAAARRHDDWRTRPPMTRLIINPTHALATYLSLLYVSQADAGILQPGRRNDRANVTRRGGRESWAVLAGRWASTSRARRARMARDLTELADADLVEIAAAGRQGRYEGFEILEENGSTQEYRPPADDATWPDVVTLPASFFQNAWHLVLTPAEIAALLVARHATQAIPQSRTEPGTGLPRSTRWSTYGLSGEAYGSIHELEKFGLLTVHDTMPHRRNGKFRPLSGDVRDQQEADGEDLAPVPYRLELADDTAFDRKALQTVHGCLLDSPAPPRLLD